MSHTVPKRDPRALSRGCGAHRYRAGGSGSVAKLGRSSVADLRGTQEGRGTPEMGWRWKCLCRVARPGCSRCRTRGRSGARREAPRTPPRVGSLPWSPQLGMAAPPRATLPGQKLPSRLLFRNCPLFSWELGWAGGFGGAGSDASASFLSYGGCSVKGRGARKTPAFPLFPTGRGSSSKTLEPRPREQRGGPGPPPPPPAAAPRPPHAADRRRSPAVPRWLRKRFAGSVTAG